MRARYFSIIFSVLFIVALGGTLFHSYLSYHERLRLIDDQARDAASNLLDSAINSIRPVDYEGTDKILSEELGQARFGKFFVIRNEKGDILFESKGAKLLPFKEIPRTPQWVTLNGGGKFVRILNLQLPRIPDRTLQVGVVLDTSFISFSLFTITNLEFLAFVLVLGLFCAWLLTSTLLKPITRLVQFIGGISTDRFSMPEIPKELLVGGNKKDELHQLVDSFSGLLDKIERSHKLSRVWSYQMAHELKTPLAIMEGEISRAKKSGEMNRGVAEFLIKELIAASETVTAFLTWAELEGASIQKNLYAVPVKKALGDIRRRLENNYPGRIHINIDDEFYVLANIQHLEHLLLNLILNAVFYSSENSPVEIFSPHPLALSIRDHGSGIPEKVIERIGDPFNHGDRKEHGNGLGLAYVYSVCKLYGWKINVNSSRFGTEIKLEFPDVDETKGELFPEENPRFRI